jgi:hypothetical protein
MSPSFTLTSRCSSLAKTLYQMRKIHRGSEPIVVTLGGIFNRDQRRAKLWKAPHPIIVRMALLSSTMTTMYIWKMLIYQWRWHWMESSFVAKLNNSGMHTALLFVDSHSAPLRYCQWCASTKCSSWNNTPDRRMDANSSHIDQNQPDPIVNLKCWE